MVHEDHNVFDFPRCARKIEHHKSTALPQAKPIGLPAAAYALNGV
jgi:hypothetical protein